MGIAVLLINNMIKKITLYVKLFMIHYTSIFAEAFRTELREIIREAVQEAIGQNGNHEGDRLLDAEEASKMLCVSEDWLYRHASRLPFTRKLGPKMLRFSYLGIQKYLVTRQIS